MTRRRKFLLWTFIAVYLFFGVFAFFFILQIPWHLAVGWVSFLFSNLSRMKFSGSSVVSAAVLVSLLLVGLQLFLRRLVVNTTLKRWPWRWTASILGMVILMFAAGISAVGIVHQLGWMMSGSERMLRNPFFDHMISRQNLKIMGRAVHEISEADGRLPQGALFDESGRALHSWETLLLPHLDLDKGRSQSTVRPQVDLTRPWTDPVNDQAFRTRLPVFLNPALGPDSVEGMAASHYAWNSHLLGIPVALKFSDITDGVSTTLLLGEVNTGHRPWGDPINWRDPGLGFHSRSDTFGGIPGQGFVGFLLVDGSARWINSDISPDVLKALSTPAAGDVVSEF
ncbi:DUF1559 domain-containing protein [Planctomicrobium sp. SH661]|uniref:DUF1559 family PulG-like putative transporter n=1 Tax=Planctomicrobium sp. SH661 TaxID=3448124 RepID=UPI003F5C1F03